MQLKIRIKTPKGNALGTAKKLEIFLLPRSIRPKLTTNKDDSEIIWDIKTDTRRAFRINKNVARFDYIIKGIIQNRIFKRAAKWKMGEEVVEELEDMLVEHTTVEIVKI